MANGITDQDDVVEEAAAQWRRERPDLDPGPVAIFGRIARIFSLQRAAQSEIHGRYGVSHASFDMLANLRRSGAPHRKTASSLAKSSMLSSGGITFRIDALERSGLIQRIRDIEDRRVVFAELTPKGLELIDDVIAHHFGRLDALLGCLSAEEREQLASLLRRLEVSMRKAMDEE